MGPEQRPDATARWAITNSIVAVPRDRSGAISLWTDASRCWLAAAAVATTKDPGRAKPLVADQQRAAADPANRGPEAGREAVCAAGSRGALSRRRPRRTRAQPV